MKHLEKYIKNSQEDLNIRFTNACHNGNLELVKYLLTSPELKEHAYMNFWNSNGFIRAYDKNNLEVIHFLIFDMNIEQTENIKKHIKKNSNEQIENMFKLRELNKFLNNELKSDKINNKKIKL